MEVGGESLGGVLVEGAVAGVCFDFLLTRRDRVIKLVTAAFEILIFLVLVGVSCCCVDPDTFKCVGEERDVPPSSLLWLDFFPPILMFTREEVDLDFELLLEAMLRALPKLVILLWCSGWERLRS